MLRTISRSCLSADSIHLSVMGHPEMEWLTDLLAFRGILDMEKAVNGLKSTGINKCIHPCSFYPAQRLVGQAKCRCVADIVETLPRLVVHRLKLAGLYITS